MRWVRMLALICAGAAVLCLFAPRPARTQISGLRRLTNTTAEGININPSLSGDGRSVAFESTEDVAGAGGGDHFRAIRANVSVDPATFYQMGGTRAVAPAISQDGSRIAFAAKDDPLETNADGNSEIFLFDGARLIQITRTEPGAPPDRVRNGNFQPSISDDGRFIAFSSNRDLAGQNSDGNLEIFVYDSVAETFAQLTNSAGIVGFTDPKISGNGAIVAYTRDNGAIPGITRDLILQPRSGGVPATVLAANVPSLQMTYGRAISDDGTRVVYSGEIATNSSQVFVYDGRNAALVRQITSLGARATDVPLHPTISGDGARIAFATRRTITGFSNSDNSIELYTFDLATGQFARVTNAPGEADGFDGTTLVTEVVSSLNDAGTIVAFNFPRVLSGPVLSGLENRSEIYVPETAARPPFGALTAILNGASFGHELSSIKALAPDSIAVARGNALANSTMQSQRLPNGSFPTNVGGTTVTVNGREAQIFFVSPGQINFLVPPQTEIGTADVIVTNADNFSSRASVPTLRTAPGLFSRSGDGIGEGMILSSDTLQEGPFDPADGNLRLTIFATGARSGIQNLVTIGGRVINAESVTPSPDLAGLDEIRVRIPADLRGAGTVSLSMRSDGQESNPVTVSFTGDPSRAVFINEILSDPPDGIGGDANHDGVRDGTQDEFIELVNGTATEDINVGGWTIRTRAVGSTTETTRFTFSAGATLPAGEGIVVFGGGGANFNPQDEVFGCARVLKANSATGLSLTNGGLTILVRDGAGNLITQFAYGGSTGPDGSNNQSLTRSPDVTGSFVQHTSAAGANGRRYSPGLKVAGTPLGNCPGRLTSVTMAPTGASIDVGQTTQFTAQAFDQFGRAMNGLPIEFTSDNASTATVDSIETNPNTGVATATVRGHNPGIVHISARATDGSATANSSQSVLTVTGPSLSINSVSLNEGKTGPTTFRFTVSLSQPAPNGGVKFDIATQDGAATLADGDYIARSLTAQIIPSGEQTYTFDVTVNGDLNIEATETFLVNVNNVLGASVGSGQGLGTILNDDSPVLSIDDVSANEGDGGTSIFTFTVTSTLPAPPGGITFDIATQDGTAGVEGNDYVSRSLAGQTITAGQQTYTFDVSVNGDILVEANEHFFVNITNVSSNAAVAEARGTGTIQNDDVANISISQVYGGGNNSGAPFRNDFVEIYNRGTTTVDFSVTPYSVQYASVGSNFGSAKTNLIKGVIAPGRYFLVQEAGGTTNGVALPAPDAIGAIALGSTSGKVALVAGVSPLETAACPGDDGSSTFNPNSSLIVDLVGYGSTANGAGHCYEGAGPASATANNTADFRKAGGCVDTNENGDDFFAASPNPRNSSSPIGDCQPEVTINDVTVTEGNTGAVNATLTVSLSTISGQPVTLIYATADGTAMAPADYQTQSGLLSFNPGELTKTITVLVSGDTLDEPNEMLFVNLSNVANAVLLDSEGRATINDNDAPPSLSINDAAIAEGDSGITPLIFTVGLSAPSGQTVTVNYATADNTAGAGSDYQSTSGALTFNAGETTKPIIVLVNGDGTFEPDETLVVNLTSPTHASISDAQAQGTIGNDDATPPTPTLFINDVGISEGDGGTSIASFSLTLSPPGSNTVTVDFATANGTATTAGNDYQTASGTLIFSPGETNKSINVRINGDLLVEPDETFTLNLSNATGGSAIGKTAGAGTIQNDDKANLVISQVYGGGNNSGAPFRNDFVEIFNRGTTTVDFSITPYSVQYASVGSNFGPNKTNLTIGTITPGKYFLVQESGGPTNGVALPTPDATGTITLSAAAGKVALAAELNALPAAACPGDDGSTPFNPNSTSIADLVGYGNSAGTAGHCYEGVGPAPGAGNAIAGFRKAGGCADTDQNAFDFFVHTPLPRNSSSPLNNCAGGILPSLTIDDVAVTEGNSGSTTATFTVSLSAPSQGADVVFDIATQNNTALSGSDYVAKTLIGQLIPAGQTNYTFDVTVNGDTTVEPDETFFVNVTNVSGATVADGEGVGTIHHDDLPTLSIDDVAAVEGNTGSQTFTFHVTLSASAPDTVTFDIATLDGTAHEGNDYQARSITAQTIPAGSSSFHFDVNVNGDLTIEPAETFFVHVKNVSGATVVDGQGQATIENDDSPALSIDDVSAAEGDSGPTIFTFKVTLSIPAGPGGVTFDIATSDGSAKDGSPPAEDNDYAARSATHTIPEGQSSFDFPVTVNGDTTVEADEAFSVNVTNVSGAGVSDGTALGTIENDDLPLVVISQLYGGGGNSGATFRNDFIEIFNRGATTVDLAGWSVQYASATGTGAWSVTPLCPSGPCLLLPGRYFLVQEDQGAGGTASLPTPDVVGTIAMTAASGKVALLSSTTPLSGACPSGAALFDKVGYGSSATCSEGPNGPATAPSNTTADIRKGGGCADNNDNASDFFLHAPAPRNSSTPANTCTGQTADIVISDVTINEGNSGTVSANFTVSLIGSNAATVTVDYATANGAAVAPDDYQSAGGTLAFNPGETSKLINVQVKGDTLDEPDETFFVNLTNATNAGILDSQAEVRITDDDVPPTLTINDVPQNETNSGTTTFSFTVHLSAPALTGGVTFDIATADGTAEDVEPDTEDGDYIRQSLIGVTIPAGSQDYAFNVLVRGDTAIESNETFLVNVSNVTGATIGDAQGQGTIQNDDSPAISINDVTQTEGDSDISIFTFTVTSSLPAPAGGITFDIATADGTAQDDNPVSEDNDYVARSLSSQIIPAGQTTYTFDVMVNGDTKNEAICETFFVSISNAVNATILDGQGQGSITDDDGPKLIITQVYGGGNNSGATFQNDFVELFNRGSSTVNFAVTPYSVQYASAAGTFSTANTISLNSGSIAAGQYFLIKLAPAVATTGAALPTADATNTAINLSATDGKVALVVGTTVATTAAGCPTGVTVADLIGYGSANCSETTATSALSATKSARRTVTCTDTNSNSADFTVVSNPTALRNSATALSPCGCSTSYSSLLNLLDDSWEASLVWLPRDRVNLRR